MGMVSTLVMQPWAFIQTFVPNSGEDAWNLAFIGKVVSETMLENGGRMDGRRLDECTISSLYAHLVSWAKNRIKHVGFFFSGLHAISK